MYHVLLSLLYETNCKLDWPVIKAFQESFWYYEASLWHDATNNFLCQQYAPRKKVLYLYIRKRKLSFEALNTPKGAHSKLGIDKKQSDESVNKTKISLFVWFLLTLFDQ